MFIRKLLIKEQSSHFFRKLKQEKDSELTSTLYYYKKKLKKYILKFKIYPEWYLKELKNLFISQKVPYKMCNEEISKVDY